MDKLLDYLKRVKNFSGSILVAKEGQIILKGGYGFADKEKGIRNSPETNYGIGSITKSVTALCIMQQVERGSVQLTARLEDILPGIYEGKGITVHHLLSQTSGIPNYVYYKEMQTGEDFSPDQILALATSKPLKFRPGEKWDYSNANYMLLAKIIEKITGIEYRQYVKDSVFSPIGMDKSYFDGDKVDNLAKHGKSVIDAKPNFLYGAGDIISNVEDLYRYDQALNKEILLSNESLNKMQQAAYSSSFVSYGYGWFVRNTHGRRSICHGGFHPIGYTSYLERYLDDRLTIIVISNELEKYSNFGVKYFGSIDVGRELAAKYFGHKVWPWQKLY
ncbi:MAG: beta-lactamase family protein [Clostridia bacterium]|nr:beta-lactamase family protein [Clostridia bacterium]